MSENTSTFTARQDSSIPDPIIDVLEFTPPPDGSNYTSFKGSAVVEIRNLFPGYILGLGKITLWAPYEDAEEQTDKCRFPDYKDDWKNASEKRKPYVWLRKETAPGEKQDRSLQFKVLGRIRRAIEARQQQQNPSGQSDLLPPQNISDEDIPF